MPTPTLYFLGSTFLGEGTYDRTQDFTHANAPFSVLYVCWTCGSPWARIQVAGARWRPTGRLCHRCGPGFLGSFNQAYTMPHLARVHDLAVSTTPGHYQGHLITGGI